VAAILLLSSSLAVATAAWLIPASIHIVSFGNGGEVGRIALFGPAYYLRWALGGGVAVAAGLWFVGVRDPDTRVRRATALAPLSALWLWTVPFLPLVPDHLPLLLVLAGPLRWLLAAAAAATTIVRLGMLTSLRWPAVSLGRKTAFACALAVYLFAGYRSLHTIGLGGDEPHYLVITQSLLLDGDLRIENNHARGDYRQYFGGPLRPDYLKRGVDGEIYSIHAPGLPALALPAFALAGAWGVVAFIALCGALAALAVFDIGALVGGTRAAWLTWASICLTVPFVPHAWAIFPEMPGAAIVAWGLLWTMREERASAMAWLWRGACIALLPWLHTKFTVFVAVLALALVYRARRPLAHAVTLSVPIAVSLVAWVGFFYVIYGTLDPQAPYGDYTAQFVRFENLPRSLAGTFFDQKFGLFVYAPIYLIAVFGVLALLRDSRWRWIAIVSLGLALAFVASSSRLYMWWGGASAPARFLVPVVPLLAPSLAAAFARLRHRVAAAHVGVALGASLLIAAVSIVDMAPPLLFSSPHGVARLAERLAGGAPLPAALPTFTEENWIAPALRLLLWLMAAGVVAGAARVAARRLGSVRRWSPFWMLLAEATTFLMVAAVLVRSFDAEARAATVRQGRFDLLTAFDPDARRGLDYRQRSLQKLTPRQWLEASRLTFRLNPDEPPDPQGRLTEGLTLPPGTYDVQVLFDDSAPRSGDLLAALGGGNLLTRVNGPLPTLASMHLPMPIPVPQLWVQMSDAPSAAAARRVDVIPQTIVPRTQRPMVAVKRVESVPGRPGAYMAYVDDNAYPEGGIFWTRGTSGAEVLIATAGAPALNLTLHAGPLHGTVRLTIDGHPRDVALGSGETRVVSVPIRPEASYVAVRVQSPGAFRPADVERGSTDTRLLGCQVRVEVGDPRD
jgi:hypothetical protein